MELCLSNYLIIYLTKNAKKIIAVSPSIKNILVNNYKIPKKKIKIILNGVNSDKFKVIEKKYARKKLKIPPTKLVLSYVGRMVKSKGYNLLKKLALNFDGELIIVNDEADKYFSSYHNIKTFKYVKQSTLNLIYSASDGLILPSVSSEGMPLVLLESLSSGTPLLVANALGNTDILNPLISEKFKPNNLKELLNKIHLLKNKSPQECRKYAEKYK